MSTIKEKQGNLIKEATDYDVLVHGCNCFCTMGKGFAKDLSERWPECLSADRATRKGDPTKMGTITQAPTRDGFTIVNAYTQYRYGSGGPHYRADAMRSCMKWVKHLFSGKKIAMPQIGAGLAGGDWTEIRQIIKDELEGEDVTIIIFDK